MTEKFIPYEKLSKKEKKKLDNTKRRTWGNLSPVTRVTGDSKQKYRRKEKHRENYADWM